MAISEKSISILELPAVLEMLSKECVSEAAKEDALKLKPSVNKIEVSKWLDETSAAKKMMVLKGSPSFMSVKDIRVSLARASLGGSLNTRELLDIGDVLRSARLVKAYAADDVLGKSCIDYMFSSLRANKFLEEKISTSIIGEDEISNSASPELADIRRKMRAASSRAREALNKIISSTSYAKALQEPIITMRSDRYVVPVKTEHKNDIPGLVHDISATGSTLFIEPMAAVKANNELRELAAKEKIEIDRILAELSAECAGHEQDISSDYTMLAKLDLIFGKAKLSYSMDCQPAVLMDKGVELRNARHPLLPKETAVPISVELGEEFDTLVITGPNTGGKTVTLKTIGLLCLMTECGLHIPAADGSSVCVFDSIYADIGDEQSIEQNLSTFSAHMTNTVNILNNCGDNSLILFDELGAGTDPTEGAALAISIIEYARSKGAVIAATTHYAELKVYATEEKRVQNASCEFNVETLKPTYKLLVGIPGKSNAFAISSRLGLDNEIIEDAKKRVGMENASFEATIEKLEQTRLMLERERDEVSKKLRQAAENEKKSAFLKAELTVRLDKANEKTKREAERIIADAKRTAEETFKELDEMRKKINEEEQTQKVNEARSELRRKLNEKAEQFRETEEIPDDRESSRKVVVGDVVKVKSMGIKATVVSVSKDGKLELRAGAMNLHAKENEVLLLEGEKDKSAKPVSKGSYSLRPSVAPEIDVRGMDSLEASMNVERYLDSAIMGKMNSVTIIHGKGTGVLRKTIHEMLKKNKHVKSYRLGNFGEGEAGVTIVELK